LEMSLGAKTIQQLCMPLNKLKKKLSVDPNIASQVQKIRDLLQIDSRKNL
jgi:chromosomal replication initiator protein